MRISSKPFRVGAARVNLHGQAECGMSTISQLQLIGMYVTLHILGKAYSGHPQFLSVCEKNSRRPLGVGKPRRILPSICTPIASSFCVPVWCRVGDNVQEGRFRGAGKDASQLVNMEVLQFS